MIDLLRVHNLSLAFAGEAPVIEGLNFELRVGESVGLSGASGAGKTVLVHSLLGLRGGAIHATEGHAAYQTKEGLTLNLFELSQPERARLRGREIGLIFQEPQRAFNPVQTVGQQLREGIRSLRPGVAQVEERLHQLLKQVELPDSKHLLQRLPGELSGGQLQRMVIALALVGQPRLLIADEPTTALDSITRAAIIRLLHRLRSELHLAMLFITHDSQLLQQATERVVRLDKPVQTTIVRSPTSVTLRQPPLLDVSDLQIAYPKRADTVINKLTLSVARGEWLALTGPSGCGKTTLAHWAVGIIAARSGTITTPQGSLQLPAPRQEVRRCTGAQLIFQDIDGSLNPRLSVLEHLRAVPGQRTRQDCGRLLQQVGLPPEIYGDRSVSSLSGGQRQRVAIARALVTNPRWLICDEAFSGLDAQLFESTMELLREVLGKAGVAALFITHDVRRIGSYVNRLLVMDRGMIVEQGPPDGLMRNPQHPVTSQLMSAAGAGET